MLLIYDHFFYIAGDELLDLGQIPASCMVIILGKQLAQNLSYM